MATAVQPAMIMAPAFNPHINQCHDPEQEFFDFSQLPSPTQPGFRRESSAVSNIASPTSTAIDEELQEAAKPSHEQQSQLHAQQQQQQRAAPRKTSSPLSDDRTEATIARVVAQIRQESQNAALASQDANGNVLPHIIRAKKDEDDMDEDERLLASEEGKKLSSKERRQLRNKVSARAFRSRRKEYIGQLEGEVAMKVNEANDLRNQNRALMEENARSRAFIERLLRHQAFGPFLEDLVREENLTAQAPLASMPSTSTPVVPASAPAPAPFQQFVSQSENTHVGMTMVPETQLDFSMLNINTNSSNSNWNMNNGFNSYQPRVFAVTELPEGPVNPLDVSAMSGKGHSTIFAVEDEAAADEEVKPDHPVIERPVQSQQPTMAAVEEDDMDSEYDLYRSSPAPSVAPCAPLETLLSNPEKAHRFTLVVSNEATEALLAERLERKMAAMEPAFQRIAAITSMLDY
ncbi:hypothetical protein EJ07DRAFT_99217 [Lizonia empirigonia]|nr:hypothetical protein EJ07DRAFT_99217 [Lizonia empirigonia]